MTEPEKIASVPPHRVPTRIIDIDGYPINLPAAYHDFLTAGQQLIDAMEKDYVDRADMRTVLLYGLSELQFALLMLPKRQ